MPTVGAATATRIFFTRLVSNSCDRVLSQPRVAGIEAAQDGCEPGVRRRARSEQLPRRKQKRSLPLSLLLEQQGRCC